MFSNFKWIFICLVIKTASSIDFENSQRCCDNGSILNEKFECTKVLYENVDNETVPQRFLDMGNKTGTAYTLCLTSIAARAVTEETGNETIYTCTDILTNGTRVGLFCESEPIAINNTLKQCDSLFSQIHFWGASMMVFATIIYNIPFIIVVIIYCILPELRYRAYDRAVSNYNMCYTMINSLLIVLGLCTALCHSPMSATTYRLFGLSLMFWTEGAVCWLFIICFDMTLVITRFRWAPKGGAERGREEKRKCIVYAAWGWGFSGVLTFIAAFIEFAPILPEDSIIRPNFHKFHEINITVVIYVMTGPALVCFAITCLFIYTTVKTMAVQKSTAIIQQNRKSNVRKKYFVFLKLYLLMDTPWLTSALAAIYKDLWILKFIKMIQPILIIVLIVPRKRIFAALSCSKGQIDEQDNLHLNEGDKENHRATKDYDLAANT